MTPPDRQGSFTNTAIWTCTLLAIAALTVWKFEIWPIASIATNTGRLDSQPVAAESIAVEPITIAAPNSHEETAPVIEKVDSSTEDTPAPPTLAKLDLASSLPAIPEPETPDWSQEPPPLPLASDAENIPSKTLSAADPECLPTGADFGGNGLFPEAKQPPAMPDGPVSPLPTDEPTLQSVSQESEVTPLSKDPYVDPAASTGDAESAAPIDTADFERETTKVDPRFAVIDQDIAENRYLAAHRALSKIYWDEPSLRPKIRSRIDQTATSIYFGPQPHYMPAHEIGPDEPLSKIAKQYHVPSEYLVRLNKIDDPANLHAGQSLKVIRGPFGAVVDLSEQTLTLHAHGYYVRELSCEISRADSLAVGGLHVLSESQGQIHLGETQGQPSSLSIESADLAAADPPPPGTIRLARQDAVIASDLLAPGSEVLVRE